MLRSLPFSHAGRVAGAQIGWRAGRLAARWGLAAVLVGGLALRLVLLSRPGLHPDEALYASWALRIAEGRDPALLGVLVDKPPLFLYQLAGLFRLAGHAGANTADLAGLVAAGQTGGSRRKPGQPGAALGSCSSGLRTAGGAFGCYALCRVAAGGAALSHPPDRSLARSVDAAGPVGRSQWPLLADRSCLRPGLCHQTAGRAADPADRGGLFLQPTFTAIPA